MLESALRTCVFGCAMFQMFLCCASGLTDPPLTFKGKLSVLPLQCKGQLPCSCPAH